MQGRDENKSPIQLPIRSQSPTIAVLHGPAPTSVERTLTHWEDINKKISILVYYITNCEKNSNFFTSIVLYFYGGSGLPSISVSHPAAYTGSASDTTALQAKLIINDHFVSPILPALHGLFPPWVLRLILFPGGRLLNKCVDDHRY